MAKFINWLKEFWFLWFSILVFYVALRCFGYDIKIEKKSETDAVEYLRKSIDDY